MPEIEEKDLNPEDISPQTEPETEVEIVCLYRKV